MDEWLQKWNRTCPLCKTSISRRGQGRREEEARLLPTDSEFSSERPSEGREGYGAVDERPRDEEEEGGEAPVVAVVTVHTPETGTQSSATAAAV